MKIYISGPITNNPRYKEQFAEAEQEITAKGHEAVNPVNLQKVLNPLTTSWDDYMALCRPLVRICDAIYMLDGWQSSQGAQIEFYDAWGYDMTIFRTLDEITEAV